MVKGVIGKKLGMTHIYKDGKELAVTAIEAGPCFVIQIKTQEKDGYVAAQLGFKDSKRINSPQKGHLKEVGQFKYLRELAIDDAASIKQGDKVDVDMFKPGDLVNISGISKGKGFAGGVKRYHFKGGPKTHGQSDRQRAPGSIGSTTTPGRVFKGLRMAGHFGCGKVTVRGIEVVDVDLERHLMLVRGAVPGAKNGLLLINKSGKGKK
jgi:large subunit ribosomal protein L3